MRVALAYSLNDPVGTRVSRMLREVLGGREASCPPAVECFKLNHTMMGGFREDVVELEMLDEAPDPGAEAVIVLSRHRAESGRKSLTVHHTGNPTRSTYGGEPERLARSYPALSKLLLKVYREIAVDRGIAGEYDVVLEATHHGPTRPLKPIIFIEVGSTPSEWSDERALKAMTDTVVHVIDSKPPECLPAAGFGGTHYPAKFTKIHLEGGYCMGHIIPKYAFASGVGEEVLRQAILNTYPAPAAKALIEKKSLKGRHREAITRVMESLGVEVERV